MHSCTKCTPLFRCDGRDGLLISYKRKTSMYPMANEVYIPSFTDEKRKVTLDEAKSGRIVALSDDGTRATVEVKIGLTVAYCGVTLDADGKIAEFIERNLNKK